jgi:hypothetical protein
MRVGKATILTIALGASSLSIAAARRPTALNGVTPGMWELDGVPGANGPARVCFADIALLARYEHRGNRCTANAVSDNGSSAVIEYSCGAAGFGRSRIDVITPRSVKINTQGISSQLPFNYTLNARRIGDCAK